MAEIGNLPYDEAASVVEERALEFLLNQKEPARTTDLSATVDQAAITPRVIREVLTHSDRFVSVNNKWDLAVRHSLPGSTLDRAVESILDTYGKPLRLQTLASELALVMDRHADYFVQTLPKFLRTRSRFVDVQNGEWARSEWVLQLNPDWPEEEVLFRNFFMTPEQAELDALRDAAARYSWDSSDLAGSALGFVDQQDRTISNRVLSYFAWKASPANFDAIAFFNTIRSSSKGLLLSGGRWCPAAVRKQFTAVYEELGLREGEEPVAAEEVEAPRVEKAPVSLTSEDLDEIYGQIEGSGRSWRVAELIENSFGLAPGDRAYEDAARQLNELLAGDERFLWVGTDRWRESGDLPEYILDVPEPLMLPRYLFEDENGDPIDFEMDDKGLEEALQQGMRSLLVQDFGDRDPADAAAGESGTDGELDSFDFWVTSRHRMTGTLLVLPPYRSLFPDAPDVIEIMVTANTGQRFPLWLNDTLETIYGLGEWYNSEDLPQSGALFTLRRTHIPGEYRLEYTGATEPRLFINEHRMEELESLQAEAEGENPLPTFEILRRVLEHYGRKGTDFTRIWAEVNVVRRTTRRMIASELSAYQCFFQVERGSDIWGYDERRLALGVNKQKRKFIRAAE